jgi:fructokinase
MMIKKNKIIAVGETTYDIIFKENKPVDGIVGGSQLNSAVSLGRMGLPVYFISQMGNDKIGDLCIGFLDKNNIDTRFINRFDGNSRVSLAFLDEQNDATYSFYRGGEADKLDFPTSGEGDYLLFGSSFARRMDIRETLKEYIRLFGSKNNIIIYDPNYRKSRAKNIDNIREITIENFSLSTIIKGSDEDFHNLFGITDAMIIYKTYFEGYGNKVLVYTRGSDGVDLIGPGLKLHYPVKTINAVSTIGAGDNFSAGMLYGLYQKKIGAANLSSLDEATWNYIISMAISFAGHVCEGLDNYITREFAKNNK